MPRMAPQLAPLPDLPPFPPEGDAHHSGGPTALPRTAAVRAQLADVLTGLDDHFTRIGAALEQTVSAIAAMLSTLGTISAALHAGDGNGAVGKLTAAAGRLHQVTGQVAGRRSEVARIRRISAALTDQVGDLMRTLEALRIYGMNVKITAGGAREFVDFAELMADKLNAGKADAEGFHARLAELERSLVGMVRSDERLASECARVVPQVPDRLIRDSAALQQHQDALGATAKAVAEAAAVIQSRVATVLGAIQIGDIARQRLEHILGACETLDAHLDRDEGHNESATSCARVLALIQAQLDDTAADFRRETQVLVASLRELEPQARRLVALQTRTGSPADGQNAEAGFLRQLEAGITEATAMIAQLQKADRQAAATLGLIVDTVRDLTSRATAIRALRIDVQLMAINIGLSCRRVEVIGRPMTVIANEIRTHSEQLDEAVTSITAAADDLQGCAKAMDDAASGPASGGTGEDLDQSLAMIREAAGSTERALCVAAEQGDTIVRMIDETRDALEISLELATRVEAVGAGASELVNALGTAASGAGEPGAEDAAGAVMDVIARSYTMAGERQVHERFRALVGPHAGPSASVSGCPQQEDDDALFL